MMRAEASTPPPGGYGEIKRMGFDEGEFLPAHVAVDPQRGEGPSILEDGFVVHGKSQVHLCVQGFHLPHESLEILHILGKDDHIEGRTIFNENHPPGIDNDPPHGLHLADANAVAFGALEQILALDDLEIPQPHDEKTDGHQDHPEEEGESLSVFARVIPDKLIGLLQHERMAPDD